MPLMHVSLPRPVAVIGDIHGSLNLLRSLVAEIGDVPLVVVGDVCDHGPNTKAVIDFLVGRGAIGVRGNHDEWLLQWAQGAGFDSFALRPVMGGRATLDSYGVTGRTPREIESERWRVPRSHLDWLSTLAHALDLEVAGRRYWVIHAGVSPLPSGVQTSPEAIVPWLTEHDPASLWTYAHPLMVPPDLGRPAVVGHQPLAEPLVTDRVIAIDTGAGLEVERPGLTAIILPEGRCLTVRAH